VNPTKCFDPGNEFSHARYLFQPASPALYLLVFKQGKYAEMRDEYVILAAERKPDDSI